MTPPNTHRAELRRQLLYAAYRERQQPKVIRPDPPPRLRLAAAAVAAAVLAVVLLGSFLVRDTRSAAADTFTFNVEGDELVISVVDTVEDPGDAAAELERRGFDVNMVAVPAAPHYEGEIISVASEMRNLRVEASDGAVHTIRVPTDSRGPLTLEYGRTASTGESYRATGSVRDCSQYADQQVTPVLRREIGERYGPKIRWQEVSDFGIVDLSAEDLAPEATIVDIIPLSDSSVLVIVTGESGQPPPGMAC